jgi:hypothetical protein
MVEALGSGRPLAKLWKLSNFYSNDNHYRVRCGVPVPNRMGGETVPEYGPQAELGSTARHWRLLRPRPRGVALVPGNARRAR